MTGKCTLSLVNYEHPYADHLAKVNDVTDVIATEDIYSTTNAMLVAKDQQLGYDAVALLKRHTLVKPLDNQIEIADCLNNHRIFQQILAMIADNPGFQELHDRCKHADKLQPICLSESIPIPLRIELTVLAERMPEEYQHSLFTAWASTIIALEMGLSQRDVQYAFICGLFHDIGILHLPGDFTNREQLSADDWRTLQNHVVIGSIIIKELGNYPNEVATGVLEHHERIDQTGYPTRKPGDKLNTFGQIVGSTDLLYKICHNELSEQSNRLAACLPYFKMHRGAFREETFNAIIRILSRCKYHPEIILCPDESKQQALKINEKLAQMESCVSEIVDLILPLLTCPSGRALTAMGFSLLETVRQSGLTMDHTYDFLDSVDAEAEIESLTEIGAMQHELLWLFKRFKWSIDDLIEDNSDWEDSEHLQALADKLKKVLISAWEIESSGQPDEFKENATAETETQEMLG